MATKLVMLKLLSSSSRFHKTPKPSDSANVIGKAVVVVKVEGDKVSIENSPLMPVSSHQCWTTFQDVCKRMLAANDALLFRLEGSTGRALNNISTLIKEPSNVLNVTVTQLVRDNVSLAASSCPDVTNQEQVDFSSIDDVLRRTQDLCQSLGSLVSDERQFPSRCPGSESPALRSLDNLPRRSVAASTSSQTTSILLGECDTEVEHLLHLSETITSSNSKVASSGVACLPDAPSKVTIIKNFQGGVYVVWDPVKLDGDERNNGHRIIGYSLCLNGQVVRTTKGPLYCQADINGLLPNKNYGVEICTCAEMCKSPYSVPSYFNTRLETKTGKVSPLSRSQSVRENRHSLSSSDSDLTTYRHQAGLAQRFTSSSVSCSQRSRSASVRSFVPFPCSSTPLTSRSSSPSSVLGPICFVDDDARSTSSAATSGIYTDCNQSIKSSLTRSRHASSSPSPLALKTHVFRGERSVDGSGEVHLASCHRRPEPPSSIAAEINGSMMSLSWKPARKTQGSGQCVLGYRVYVNEHPIASVDGAGTGFALVDLPSWLIARHMEVDVRTRTISSESSPSPCPLYLAMTELQGYGSIPISSSSPRYETCV